MKISEALAISNIVTRNASHDGFDYAYFYELGQKEVVRYTVERDGRTKRFMSPVAIPADKVESNLFDDWRPA